MKVVNVRCMSLPDGVPVPQFEKLTEAVAHMKGDESKAVEIFNKYGRQKDSLVNARDWLSAEIEKVFKRLKKDGKEPTSDTEDTELETETSHLDRFASSVANGRATVQGVTVTGTDEKEKVASVWKYMQGLINAHGPFPFDLNAATRVGGGGFKRKIPTWALNAAKQIIANGSEAGWVTKLTTGYKGKDGIVIDPVTFQPFTTPVPKGTKPEDAEKIRTTNAENLARAIVAVEEQRAAKKSVSEYV